MDLKKIKIIKTQRFLLIRVICSLLGFDKAEYQKNCNKWSHVYVFCFNARTLNAQFKMAAIYFFFYLPRQYYIIAVPSSACLHRLWVQKSLPYNLFHYTYVYCVFVSRLFATSVFQNNNKIPVILLFYKIALNCPICFNFFKNHFGTYS